MSESTHREDEPAAEQGEENTARGDEIYDEGAEPAAKVAAERAERARAEKAGD